MRDKRKIIEHAKSALIVVLLISAVFLLYETGYYSSAFSSFDKIFFSNNDASQKIDASDAESGSMVSSRARMISVCLGPNGRYGSAYNSEFVEEDYSRFSAFLAEALGSASAPTIVDEAYWVKALESESVYFDYYSQQYLSLLSLQLGTKLSAGAQEAIASEFCLSCEGETVYLLYRCGDEFYSCSTAVSNTALRERIHEYIPNNALFSHSDKLLSGMKSSELILKTLNSVPAIQSGGNPDVGQMLEILMPALGVNEYTTSSYKESDGTAVYVDSNSVMRLSASGYASYELSGEAPKTASDTDVKAAIDFCWEIVNSTVGKSCGEANLYISQIDAGENGEFIVSYDYMLNGVPIRSGGRHAAVLIINNAELTNAELYFRSYLSSDAELKILPMYQAAAMASANGSEGIELRYYDVSEIIDCFWVNE